MHFSPARLCTVVRPLLCEPYLRLPPQTPFCCSCLSSRRRLLRYRRRSVSVYVQRDEDQQYNSFSYLQDELLFAGFEHQTHGPSGTQLQSTKSSRSGNAFANSPSLVLNQYPILAHLPLNFAHNSLITKALALISFPNEMPPRFVFSFLLVLCTFAPSFSSASCLGEDIEETRRQRHSSHG